MYNVCLVVINLCILAVTCIDDRLAVHREQLVTSRLEGYFMNVHTKLYI
jgi:hypothetical protein